MHRRRELQNVRTLQLTRAFRDCAPRTKNAGVCVRQRPKLAQTPLCPENTRARFASAAIEIPEGDLKLPVAQFPRPLPCSLVGRAIRGGATRPLRARARAALFAGPRAGGPSLVAYTRMSLSGDVLLVPSACQRTRAVNTPSCR